MKNIKSIFVFPLFTAIVLLSCEKADPKVTFLGGTAPSLTASSTSPLVLSQAQAAYSSLQFQWTDPSYQFSNGVNTQDVYYTLQIDTVGANGSASFTNPNMVQLPFTAEVSTSYTVKGLNTVLAGLQLADYVPHNFAFRIKATLASNGAQVSGGVPVYSNVVKITISTYLDVVYPVPASLFITGSATAKSWMGGGDAAVVSQQFTKTNSYTFVLSGFPIIGGQEFLLVPVYGNWTNKYGTVGANDTNNTSGDAFVPAGNNFLAPAASKAYTITVNFKTGKYSIQ